MRTKDKRRRVEIVASSPFVLVQAWGSTAQLCSLLCSPAMSNSAVLMPAFSVAGVLDHLSTFSPEDNAVCPTFYQHVEALRNRTGSRELSSEVRKKMEREMRALQGRQDAREGQATPVCDCCGMKCTSSLVGKGPGS